ncbi:MAG: nucleolar DEAD-box protein required for synthesis of 60S ribosomal subunit [Watsoniomyces obsoletus]|nr:MAG: nucleolar DEAD-box protein required for synthesis of 60S ribosomal subunit [Watsoniomyces obsoletus]
MSTDYNYDEKGQFFPFFILTICGLVTLPLTYSSLKPSKELENTAPRIQTDYKPEHADLIEGQKRKQRRRERKLKRMLTALTGWLIIGWMIYLIISTARTIPKIWDPYDILGISRSSTEKAIKSHYKRLSLKYHPDKIRPDPAKNQTAESLNNQFVELTKAYKALTDEEVRNNYRQYGHPDGKQSMSIGIALPKFIVTEGNGKYVLLVYGLLLGVLLPYIVGRWWYGTQRMTKDKVLVASAGNLFREYEDTITEGGVVSALSVGDEFKEVLTGDRAEEGISSIESRILVPNPNGLRQLLSEKDCEKLKRMESGVRRKVTGLLWAYLGRIDLGDATLNDEKYEAAPIALALNESFLAISLAYGNIGPILSAFHTSQNLIQALPPQASPLLQLPYMTPAIAQNIEGPSAKIRYSVQRFMRLPEDERRRLTTGPDRMSESQYQAALTIARQIPVLKVEGAYFKVVGERFITPSSLVQFVVKARVIPPGTTSVPEVSEDDLEDIDPEEDDLDALLGRKKKSSAAGATKNDAKPGTGSSSSTKGDDSEKTIQPPLAFAPYFARDHSPRWHVFLTDSKQGKIAVPPFTFASFDKPVYEEDDGVSGGGSGSGIGVGVGGKGIIKKPTLAIQTFKMQFQAPPQAGQYTFVMHLVCDSYSGTDTKMEVTLDVDEMARAEEFAGEDEISEPEEDSLAGQMSALKTGGLKGAAASAAAGGAGGVRRRKRPVKKNGAGGGGGEDDEDEDDDDESDTEGEADDAGSDTNTDTDTDEE